MVLSFKRTFVQPAGMYLAEIVEKKIPYFKFFDYFRYGAD